MTEDLLLAQSMSATIAGRRVRHSLRYMHTSTCTRLPARTAQSQEPRDYFCNAQTAGILIHFTLLTYLLINYNFPDDMYVVLVLIIPVKLKYT